MDKNNSLVKAESKGQLTGKEKRLLNLKPFTKKDGPNPPPKSPGHPKGPLLTTLLRQALEKNDFKEAKALIEALIQHGKKGNQTLIKEALDRIDGKVPDKVESDKVLTVIINRQGRIEG
ncbi:MAG: hypothetical protein ABSB79_06405 [Syntrophales bacterium]|jgi:hypothetical protein